MFLWLLQWHMCVTMALHLTSGRHRSHGNRSRLRRSGFPDRTSCRQGSSDTQSHLQYMYSGNNPLFMDSNGLLSVGMIMKKKKKEKPEYISPEKALPYFPCNMCVFSHGHAGTAVRGLVPFATRLWQKERSYGHNKIFFLTLDFKIVFMIGFWKRKVIHI